MGVRGRSRGTRKRADGLDHAALTADDLARVLLVDTNFDEDGAIFGFARIDDQVVRVIDERTDHGLYEPSDFLGLRCHQRTPARGTS